MSQKERLSSLGRLSTVIAHEVRNPLMIIKAALHSLRQPDVAPAALGEAAADIDEEVARLNRIVNEVLDFARPIRFELAPADLNALCRESAAAAEASAGVPVELDFDPSLGPITTDPERLRIALVNLIVNARQAVDSREDAFFGSPATTTFGVPLLRETEIVPAVGESNAATSVPRLGDEQRRNDRVLNDRRRKASGRR